MSERKPILLRLPTWLASLVDEASSTGGFDSRNEYIVAALAEAVSAKPLVAPSSSGEQRTYETIVRFRLGEDATATAHMISERAGAFATSVGATVVDTTVAQLLSD